MSTLSQFVGGAGIPVGAPMPYLASGAGVASRLVVGGQEFLRAGSPLVAYNSNYAAVAAANPMLARFGRRLDLGLSSTGTTPTHRIVYDGVRYYLFSFRFDAGQGQAFRTSTDLTSWSSEVTMNVNGAGDFIHGSVVAYGGGFALVMSSGLRWELRVGSFSSSSVALNLTPSTSWSPTPSNIEFDGTTGAILFTDGSSQVGRRTAASPDGTWTASACTGAVVDSNSSLAGSGSVWVAVPRGSPIGSSSIRSSPDAINWTARSLTVPATLSLATTRGTSLVWTGSTFLLAMLDSATQQIFTARSTDGIAWTVDSAPVPSLIGGASASATDMCMCTDRAGRVALAVGFDNQTANIAYSTDSGVNWSMARLPGVVTLRGVTIPNNPVPCGQMNFANGELILNQVNFSGSGFGRPTLVGATTSQLASSTPQFVGALEAITFASGVPAYFRIR